MNGEWQNRNITSSLVCINWCVHFKQLISSSHMLKYRKYQMYIYLHIFSSASFSPCGFDMIWLDVSMLAEREHVFFFFQKKYVTAFCFSFFYFFDLVYHVFNHCMLNECGTLSWHTVWEKRWSHHNLFSFVAFFFLYFFVYFKDIQIENGQSTVVATLAR